MNKPLVQIPKMGDGYGGCLNLSSQYIQGNMVPPTPGPRTMEAIQSDARDRFAGITWIQKDSSHKLEDYFAEYDYSETYSESKSYSKRTYQAAYKGIMRDYQNHLCILSGEEGEEYYVVAKRIRNELETLEPYCCCSTCTACILNPLKYIWCPNCTKCIKAGPGFAKEEYIVKARELKIAAEQRKRIPSKYGKYGKYLQEIHWIKASELVVAAVTVIAIMYALFI